MTYPLLPRVRKGLGDFSVGEELGEGALSQVHVAVENASGKKYAIKLFDRQKLRSNHKDADVVMEEHCLRRANHPSVAKLVCEFRDAACWFLVLELCPGGELWEMVREAGCSDKVGRHYLSQAVEAISYLRDARIVHRDVKGENMLIGERGNVKLVDFGTAKDLNNPHIKGAGTRSFKKVQEDNVGTPNFMAPEVVKNKCSDFRSDTWSLGLTIYQILSGIQPFGTNLLKVYVRSGKRSLARPSGMSHDAWDLIQRMVVLDPNARLGAQDVRDLRKHAFFGGLQEQGTRFEGAHLRAAPVPSLEELCLRAVGKRWKELAPRAAEHAVTLKKEGGSNVQATLKRFRCAGERAARCAARRERSSAGDDGGSSPSSVGEDE